MSVMWEARYVRFRSYGIWHTERLYPPCGELYRRYGRLSERARQAARETRREGACRRTHASARNAYALRLRTVDDAVNKSFDFGHLRAGDRVHVRKTFTDYNGSLFEAGDTWRFACAYYLPYDGGYTLYISHDEATVGGLYLQEEQQRDICAHPADYFEVIAEE